jgi:hypothetical protein
VPPAAAEAGDESVLPDLSRCLMVAELAELAGEAMWAIFMRSKEPQVRRTGPDDGLMMA